MGFRVSPGVSITEKDLTAIIPAVASTPGGFAGYFHWGPANEIVTVTTEKELVDIFGKPETSNYVDFFTVANFLAYGNNCGVVRTVGATSFNSTVTATGLTYPTAAGGIQIANETEFLGSAQNTTTLPVAGVAFASKFPGILGNSLKVVVTNGTGLAGYSLAYAATLGDTTLKQIVGLSGTAYSYSVGDQVVFGDGTSVVINGISKISGTSGAPVTTVLSSVNKDFFGVTSGFQDAANAPFGVTLQYINLIIDGMLPKDQILGATFNIKSVYARNIGSNAVTTAAAIDAGGTGDLVNVLVLDKLGLWTGTVNSVIEKFEGCSRATDATNFDGSSNYYKTVVNDKSNYIYSLSADVGNNTSKNKTTSFAALSSFATKAETQLHGNVLSLGLTGASTVAPDVSIRYSNGWSKFADPDQVDVSLLPLGDANATLCSLVIQNICEPRKDCMAFASPGSADVVNRLPYEALSAIKTFRDNSLNINSSYAVLDSGWKYQLDTYNNVVRTMPLNPDIAGLVARTEFTNEAWFSPAGFNRGQIKNVVKLAYNPTSEGHRDELYTRQINPVVSFPGEGTILFGDKTMQTRPSAFDRINVRRLFIVLEKAIATASKFFLFEQNDAFTRAQFKNLIVPFLKTVQARRGITDFLVVCDDSNNTGEVIDRNEFVADIFVKPTRSINFIQLNFIATRTGVSFSEVAGA